MYPSQDPTLLIFIAHASTEGQSFLSEVHVILAYLGTIPAEQFINERSMPHTDRAFDTHSPPSSTT